MDFLDYAVQNRIAIMKFPSHSTHSLQPLDVGIFSPLSSVYSSELCQQQQRSQGLLPIKKADFYSLFKRAWASAASESNIKAAFKATGIWPQDRTVVLKKFKIRTPPPKTNPVDVSYLSPADWKRVEQLLEHLVADKTDEQFKKLEGAIHRASTETKLLRHENTGLIASLDTYNKRTEHGRRLLIGGSKKQQTDAGWYSPRRLEKERREIAMKDEAKVAQKAANHTKQQLQKAKKALDQKHKEARQEAAKKKREEKAMQKAERAAENQRKKEERDRQKAHKSTQKGKRKASTPLPKPKKKQKSSGGGVVGSAMHDVGKQAASPPPPRQTRLGRNVNLPFKFR